MELWVHVSRLLVPHLDNDKWKHYHGYIDGLFVGPYKIIIESYSGIEIIWVHVSRLPMPHLDSDKWRHFILNISSPSGK